MTSICKYAEICFVIECCLVCKYIDTIENIVWNILENDSIMISTPLKLYLNNYQRFSILKDNNKINNLKNWVKE